MVKISKEESIILRKAFPDLEISRTMRNRRGKNYYIPEYIRVLRFLENYWASKTIKEEGANNA